MARQQQFIDLLPSDDWTTLLDAMPDAVLITIHDTGRILHANLACEDVYGFPVAGMIGRTTVELGIFTSQRQRQALLASQEGQLRFRTEHIFYNARGEERFGLFSGQHISYREQHCLIITGRDITHIKMVEQALIESKHRYDILAEGTLDIPWEINPLREIVYIGPSIRQWGYQEKDWLNKRITQFIHPEDRERFIQRIDTLFGGETITEYLQIRILSKQGSYADAEITTAPIYDSFGYIVAIYGIMRDISHHIQDREKFEKLAIVDDLTRLYNRRYFISQVDKLIHASKGEPSPGYIMFMDLDGFKLINDNYGHEAGDQALQRIADQLQKTLRKMDIICRIGGDEFAAIVHDTDEAVVKAICTRIFEAMDELSFDQDIKLGISIGLARIGPDSTADSLLNAADTAMYEAKSQGKNQFRIHP